MATIVTGEEYYKIDGQLLELTRQLRQQNGYPHDLKALSNGLQDLIEGRFRTVNIVPVSSKATWEVQGDLIYLTLPASQGLTLEQWIDRLEVRGKRVSPDAKKLLRLADFQPTPVGFVHRLVVLKATFWRKDSARTTSAIHAKGVSEKWFETHPEAICIVREYLSDEDLEKMGLKWLVGVHKTIEVDGCPRWLGAPRCDGGGWLGARQANPKDKWEDDGAFFWSLSQENHS